MYTILGRTGLKVSKISFGGIPIQRSDADNTNTVVNALLEHGINYIDTARGYTVSEEYLGKALMGRRDKFILATKSMARDYDAMKADIAISLNNLQTNYIDIYQIHNIGSTEFDKVFGNGGAYEALLEAKKEGRIGFIGATAHSTDSLTKLVDEYSDIIDTLMFPYNIVELQGEAILKKAQSLGIGTIAMKPLAGGNIDDYNLALRFIANSEVIDISIPGMGDVSEVTKNAEVMTSSTPLTAEELKACEKIRAELGENFCRRCGYCSPCSVGIDIPTNFLIANYYRKYEGLKEWAVKRYGSFSINASACIKCGKCEPRCPYNLPIISMLESVAKEFSE